MHLVFLRKTISHERVQGQNLHRFIKIRSLSHYFFNAYFNIEALTWTLSPSYLISEYMPLGHLSSANPTDLHASANIGSTGVIKDTLMLKYKTCHTLRSCFLFFMEIFSIILFIIMANNYIFPHSFTILPLG